MLFTLHRYILRDLLKVFLVTSVILSLVLGLGVMLRPLKQFSVDPVDVPELLLCTLPITVTMVLPVTALLAATLVYGRLAGDNEIVACRSSGINLLALIYPGLGLALLVGAATLVLSFHVIPKFVARSEAIIKSNVEAIIYRNIEKMGNLGRMFPNIQIHADRADPAHHQLFGVVVLQLDFEGIERLITARQVSISLKEGRETDQVGLTLYDCMMIDNENQTRAVRSLPMSVSVPRLLGDNIKFKQYHQLKAILADMTQFAPIRVQLKELQQRLLAERFFEECDRQLARNGYFDLEVGDQHRLRIYAQGCQLKAAKSRLKSLKNQLRPLKRTSADFVRREGRPIKLEYYHRINDKQPEKTYQAEEGLLTVSASMGESRGQVSLKEVQWNYADDDHLYHLQRENFVGLNLPGELVQEVEGVSLSKEVMPGKIPLKKTEPSEYLKWKFDYLRTECRQLGVDIRAEVQARLAFGISCVVLVLMGAALGILFRSSHLLTAFGVSFIPAVLCLITIFTGKHIAEQNPDDITMGIVFLWSGLFVVAGATVMVYKTLLKH